MKILITSEALTLEHTSEGICTSKFVWALHKAGFDLRVLTSDPNINKDEKTFSVSWLNNLSIQHIQQYSQGENKTTGNRVVFNKLDALYAYLTGWNLSTWKNIYLWRRAIYENVKQFKPDLVFVRGAGSSFQPHMAMVIGKFKVPWVANYHDPFPLSLYPEPYRRVTPVLSAQQEKHHRRILQKADALSFPSERLMNWVLRVEPKNIYEKAYVIPHLACALPVPETDSDKLLTDFSDHFLLLHLGSLLGPRNPNILYQAYASFLNKSNERRKLARMVMLGTVSKQHLGENHLRDELIKQGNLYIYNQRINYGASLQYGKKAVALIIIEAASKESPFFPAKLTDYLWLNKPILALTPEHSTTRDILGPDYPLAAIPNNLEEIEHALTIIWNEWIDGKAAEMLPNSRALSICSEDRVMTQLNQILQRV